MTKKDKRCKNCGERIDAPSPMNPAAWICPHVAGLLNNDGPPWHDCRFWAPVILMPPSRGGKRGKSKH